MRYDEALMLRRLRRFVLLVLRETQNVTIGLTALAILRLRNAQSVYLALGATTAGLTAKALKRIVRQPRPTHATKETYGMPSTHSASIAFFGAYLSCLSLFHPPLRAHEPLPLEYGLPLATIAIVVTGAVCWSRVWFGHHTPLQVLAGASLGTTMGLIGFAIYPSEFAWRFDRATDIAWPLFVDALRNHRPEKLTSVFRIYASLIDANIGSG